MPTNIVMPRELSSILLLPWKTISSLPTIDGTQHPRSGICYRPYYNIGVFDASYIAFLDDQIKREPRGKTWTDVLKRRREALAPYVNVLLRNYAIYWDNIYAWLRVKCDIPEIIYWEIESRSTL
jgi:hypothetical protein